MKTDALFTRPNRAEETPRQIALRSRGHSHGGLTRLVSPGDIGERIKPFVACANCSLACDTNLADANAPKT